jgi:hypothetical protein
MVVLKIKLHVLLYLLVKVVVSHERMEEGHVILSRTLV